MHASAVAEVGLSGCSPAARPASAGRSSPSATPDSAALAATPNDACRNSRRFISVDLTALRGDGNWSLPHLDSRNAIKLLKSSGPIISAKLEGMSDAGDSIRFLISP